MIKTRVRYLENPGVPPVQENTRVATPVQPVQAKSTSHHTSLEAGSRMRVQSVPQQRRWAILVSFTLFFAIPITLAGFYLWQVAAEEFTSRVGFSVRAEERGSAIELLGGIREISGARSGDADALFAYLSSQGLVERIDQQVDLRKIWARVSLEQDPIAGFDPTDTIEELHKHWERKVTISFDNATGLIEIEVRAFDPDDALQISGAILEESTQMINALSQGAQQDAIKFTKAELTMAIDRLKAARRAVMAFRNRTQIVDPTIDTQNQMGVLVTLQQQLANALIDYDLLRDTTRDDDPRVAQASKRIEVINTRIASERQNLGLGEASESGEVFAAIVGEYEGLVVDREFAEASYLSALAAHDSALADARRQSRYLAAHIKPTLAQSAMYPRRLQGIALVAVICFLIWSLFCLVYYSVRDRRV